MLILRERYIKREKILDGDLEKTFVRDFKNWRKSRGEKERKNKMKPIDTTKKKETRINFVGRETI